MLTKISARLDAVADQLEAKGLIKEAYEIDRVADELDATGIFTFPSTSGAELISNLEKKYGKPEDMQAFETNMNLVWKNRIEIQLNKNSSVSSLRAPMFLSNELKEITGKDLEPRRSNVGPMPSNVGPMPSNVGPMPSTIQGIIDFVKRWLHKK